MVAPCWGFCLPEPIGPGPPEPPLLSSPIRNLQLPTGQLQGNKGKASETSKTVTITLQTIGTDVLAENANHKDTEGLVLWTMGVPTVNVTVNVASDNKRTLFIESGGSRATKGGDLDLATFKTLIHLTPVKRDDGDPTTTDDGDPHTTAAGAGCVLERFGTDFDQDGLADKLFGKLTSALGAPQQADDGRLFDFQVRKDPLSLGVFALQWEEGDEVFRVGIAPSLGFPIKGFTPPQYGCHFGGRHYQRHRREEVRD